MRAKNILTLILLLVLCAMAAPASAVRIKDMANVRGVRGNQLIGYGLVVGLNGTGDKSSTTFTTQGLANMLTRMGLRVTPDQLKVKNVAAVMVTAELPAFSRNGTRIDVTMSSWATPPAWPAAPCSSPPSRAWTATSTWWPRARSPWAVSRPAARPPR